MHKIINDPVHGFISIRHELLLNLIDHPYFQRLRHILQLGLTNYVYPGANHSRFHHALGAMHLMMQALEVLKDKHIEISEEEYHETFDKLAERNWESLHERNSLKKRKKFCDFLLRKGFESELVYEKVKELEK
jgi:HD superfamily phosphohydrolase